VYSDGSKLDSGNAGGGYAAFQNSHKIAEASLSYGKNAEVFDAEARAAVAGISDIQSKLDIRIRSGDKGDILKTQVSL
jgi:ssDNA-binding replication factor A large subunit